MDADVYSFVKACDVHENVSLRILRLGGEVGTSASMCVRCELYAGNMPLLPPEYTSLSEGPDPRSWDEWITFPYDICDLPLDAQISLTVLDVGNVPLGGIVLPLFGKRAALRRGTKCLALWRGVPADPRAPSSTPYRYDDAPISKLWKRHQRGMIPSDEWLDQQTLSWVEKARTKHVDESHALILIIELPDFELPVVYGEPEPDLRTRHTNTGSWTNATAPVASWIRPHMLALSDPEALCENVIEAKHRRLIRGRRSATLDRERKPTASVRDTLHQILMYPPTRVLTSEEMDLVWTFRFFLTRYPEALTKFVKSVVWMDAEEARQATDELLPMWAEPRLADTLELLGPSFQHLQVRAYAVRQLHRASNDQLELYLLQLVQALKFEDTAWNAASDEQRQVASTRLVDLLCERSTQSHTLGTKLYWYVSVERIDGRYRELFARVDRQLQASLEESNRDLLIMLKRQRHFVHTLTTHNAELRVSRDARPKKIEKLQDLLADRRKGLCSLVPPLSLPLDPDVYICGVIPDKSTVFKSNLFPWRLEFAVDGTSSTYAVIVKNGDDLRQDQLVLQLFALMDRLLRDENLDVRITPYHVLATSPQDGLVQFIPSMTVAAAVAQYGDLLSYLRFHYPDHENATTFHVQAQVLDTFVRSCAGYCVITYLLGVGDRHLDNLLVAPDGHFFHVDFGYILGRDPKPFPPPVKVCKEMVDAMGGTSSVYYMRFKKLSYTTFACLRKNANLILNLISLMVDANIPDIRAEPDKAVLKVQDKFMLGVSEEQAVRHLEALFNETSYLSSMFDRLHNVAQYFRQ